MTRQRVAAVIFTAALFLAAPAAAQTAGDDPNPGGVTVTGGFDVVNAYHFRGIPQDEGDFGTIMWPYVDLGFALFSGDGGLKSIGLNLGSWNSLHTGLRGLDGFGGKLWYESDFYATVGFGFGGGTSVGVTYTAYTSPNGSFSTVKEIGFKFAVDDTGYLGGAAVRPYILIAKELALGLEASSIASGGGQADGGSALGTYVELGIAPGYTASRLGVAVPVKVGLSLGDYYQGAVGDERFGFFSLGGVVTVPFTSAPAKLGIWNVHGGVEYLRLGEFNQGFGESQLVGSVGLGFSY